ncbi:SDR family oxidoreductase [Streptomyces sp. NPDC050211]|uniref:SDR family oxidoreductase n=1 Tax=Streptomyces sp. NPDC050211 TaxID=3154932 RepID=UPI003421D311
MRAPFLLVAALVPGVVRRQNRSIVLIGSGPARIPAAVGAAYGASKAGTEMLARYWAIEFGPSDVRVNAVSLTTVHVEGAAAMLGGHAAVPDGTNTRGRAGGPGAKSPMSSGPRPWLRRFGRRRRGLGSREAAGDACGDAPGPLGVGAKRDPGAQPRFDWSSSRTTGTRVMPGC